MSVIRFQKKADMTYQKLENGIMRTEMLPGMVEGVHTYKCLVKAGDIVTLETFADTTQLIYFTKGNGYITTPNKAFNIEEPSLYIPNMTGEVNDLHAVTDMEYLQMTCFMIQEDITWFDKWHISLPRFCPLKDCIQYVEKFRPKEIKAYSIIDTHFMTRMTMGAIIGKGPNKAEPHSHDDLYQWYYGMEGTKFTYKAGDEQIVLTEGDWAFIPTHVQHAIEVEEHENVNYVWFEIAVPEGEQ